MTMLTRPVDLKRALGISPQERAELDALARLAWRHGLTDLGYEGLRKLRALIDEISSQLQGRSH